MIDVVLCNGRVLRLRESVAPGNLARFTDAAVDSATLLGLGAMKVQPGSWDIVA
jgi:hypothetical protein